LREQLSNPGHWQLHTAQSNIDAEAKYSHDRQTCRGLQSSRACRSAMSSLARTRIMDLPQAYSCRLCSGKITQTQKPSPGLCQQH
jgi:hypothetical protein